VGESVTNPFVTILVPSRNEARFIRDCLLSILANSYPKDLTEVLVIDGLSDDGTRKEVERIAADSMRVKMVDNPRRTTPCALNVGIQQAKGDVVVRMDAHATYPQDYISKLIDWQRKSGADNVGGIRMAVAADRTPMAMAIAYGMSHPFAVGTSNYQAGLTEPKWVDTVWGGCFKKELFKTVGLFDEQLIRNQDDEFNQRLIARGGRILLVPDVVSYYYPRSSLAQLWRMFYQYGYFKPLVALKLGRIGTVRQLIPIVCLGLLVGLSFVSIGSHPSRLTLLLLIVAYLLADFTVSFAVGLSSGLRCVGWMLLVFPVMHVSYGLGYARGILDFWIRRKLPDIAANSVPLSR